MKTGKHVIFLGAGASKQSGYPLANDLRLLISSRKKWEEALVKYEGKHKLVDRPITTLGKNYWDYHVLALDLFRNGGFATIDEFCKLAGGFSFQSEINNLRCLLRAALGLFNPEENFENSEYYGFIQSLFGNDLVTLREDITVLTYNYDPYLEFLLYRALEHRFKVIQKGKSPVVSAEDFLIHGQHDLALNSATGGFGSLGNQQWLDSKKTKPSFCLLKLHGSIVNVANQASDFKMLFSDDDGCALRRAEKLFGKDSGQYMPPILFPWEIMNEKGFVDNDSFPFHNSPALYSLFRGIWEAARDKVQAADRISFVGLSMHSFLLDGLKYLFKDKEGRPEICVANPDSPIFIEGQSATHWQNQQYNSANAVANVLGIVAPNMGRWGKVSGRDRSEGDMTIVKTFEDFIKKQMLPFDLP